MSGFFGKLFSRKAGRATAPDAAPPDAAPPDTAPPDTAPSEPAAQPQPVQASDIEEKILPVASPPIETDAESLDIVEKPPAAAGDARELLFKGFVAEAAAALDTSDSTLASFVADIYRGEVLLGELALPALEPGTRPGILLAQREAATSLVIVFGTEQGNFFQMPDCVIEADAHVLFIQDMAGRLGLLGITRLGETLPDCLATIGRIASALGEPDIFCLGGGGMMYAALRYGLALGAQGVLGLGSFARLDPDGPEPLKLLPKTVKLIRAAGGDMEAAYQAASVRPALILCRPLNKAGALEAHGFAKLSDVLVLKAPEAAAPRIMQWAVQSGRLKVMLGQFLALKQVRAEG